MERHGYAPDFSGEDEEVDEEHDEERRQEGVEAETLAYGIGDRMVAHRREAARHLDEEGEAHDAEHDRPDERVAVARSRLNGGRQRAGLEESADAGDHTEGNFKELLH